MRQKLNEELAERGTESLAKLFEGAFGVAEFMAASEVDVPGALGLTPDEWMERRISGPVRLSIEERRKVVAELPPEMSTRDVAEVLGVDHATVARDRNAVADATPDAEDPPPEAEPKEVPVADATPDLPPPDDEDPEPSRTRGQLSNQAGGTDEWETPQELFDELHGEFGFDLDVCALDSSAKCARYFTPENDGLAQEWAGTCWMNPPYGETIGQWIEKAHDSATAGATVVCLVPARVDTGWWWNHCRYGEVRFLRGRLRFGTSTNSAPFPSAVVIFGRPAAVKWWER